MTASIPRLSREYMYSTVESVGEDAALLNTLPVAMAFLTTLDEPVDGDWVTGSWMPGTTIARVLVGPGSSAVLAVGTYNVWLRITGATERPVRTINKLKVV